MSESVVTLNLEIGYPTVEEARHMLKAELEKCRSQKVIAIKVIHGYGSSGVGGALRQGIRKSLISRRQRRQREGSRLRRKMEHLRFHSTVDVGAMSRVEQRQRSV